MPSKKQRRRQQKLKRHEWEEVYVDEEGRELDPEEAEQLLQPAKTARTKAQPADRGRRVVEPPSWRRTLKRGALFFPLMLIVVFFLGDSEVSTAAKIIQTVTLMAFFLPFSYVMDSVVWRSYQRRLTRSAPAKKR